MSDLAFVVGITDSAVSHALRLLRAHGMVTAHRAGRMVHYRVAGELTARLLDVVSDDVVGDVDCTSEVKDMRFDRSSRDSSRTSGTMGECLRNGVRIRF